MLRTLNAGGNCLIGTICCIDIILSVWVRAQAQLIPKNRLWLFWEKKHWPACKHKNPYCAKFCKKFVPFSSFSAFCTKTVEKAYFDQCLKCAASKCWLKYSTLRGYWFIVKKDIKINFHLKPTFILDIQKFKYSEKKHKVFNHLKKCVYMDSICVKGEIKNHIFCSCLSSD